MTKSTRNENAWSIGDEVQLKSGGPIMTVFALTEAGVECRWFSDSELRGETFPPGTLKAFVRRAPVQTLPRRRKCAF